MPVFYDQLCLEYFQAKATRERTLPVLAGIVAHVAQTYALGPEETRRLRASVELQAQQRGLVRQEEPYGTS